MEWLPGWPEKQSRRLSLPFPRRVEFCDVYWPRCIPIVPGTTQTCGTAPCRCTNIVTTTKESTTAPRSLSVWGEWSCAHTKRAAVFFKRTAREPGIRGTKLSHSPWTMCIKNIFTSLVQSAYFREWEHPGCPVGKDEDEVKEDAGCSRGVNAAWKFSYLGLT